MNTMQYHYILFDLDGTLTDPKIGITSCVQYALRAFGIEEPDLNKLEYFIGPPLRENFMESYGFSEEMAEQATEKYRERFQPIGIYENVIYPGIREMLERLKESGVKLAVASSKPEVFVKEILRYFEIEHCFDVVTGSELDGTRDRKEEVVEEAVRRLFGDAKPDYAHTAMVGDRRFDIEGGKAWNITTVGVSYGYAAPGELEEAGADFIAHSVEELANFLLSTGSI